MTDCFAFIVFFGCFIAVNVPWFFLTVPWVGLQRALMAFPDHTYLLSDNVHNGHLTIYI